MSVRVSRARAELAQGRRPSVVARVAGISRQAIYRVPRRRPRQAGPGRVSNTDAAIVESAKANQLWVAQHGWAYMHAIIDCLTREITAWTLDLRARTKEAIDCLEHALAVRHIEPGQLTLGTDNGPQFTSRGFRRHLTDRGIAHRRGGYRDPESQAFIESWFGQFKKRLAWRAEWETLDHARQDITSYVNSYQHRPHSGIGYQTPTELATTWKREPLHTRAT